MIIKENSSLTGGYMVDKYENLIKVNFHPYGDFGDIEANSGCTYFLFLNSDRNTDAIKKMLINYVAYCLVDSDFVADTDLDIETTLIKDCHDDIANILDDYEATQTLNAWNITNDKTEVYNNLFSLIDNMTIDELESSYDEDDTSDNAYRQINQLYTRCRVGGRYDNDGEDCFYGRVSSSGYDWGNTLFNIIYNKFSGVKYVTLERDKEACGTSENYKIYSTRDNQPINHMPMNDFINQEHIPLLASVTAKNLTGNALRVYDMLKEGHSIIDIKNKMNTLNESAINHCYSKINLVETNTIKNRK